jgi:hypothetical protein
MDGQAFMHEALNLRVIIIAARDSLMKNRRIGRHASQVILANASIQLAALEHATREIIDPVGLTTLAELT